jgi:hypothetical protein
MTPEPSVVAVVLAFITMAAIPWALALPVLRWHPGMQTRPARRTYRLATAGAALVLSAVAYLPGVAGLTWFAAIALAFALDVVWFTRSRREPFRSTLAHAKAES